ncbi:MAG: single-stranded DNA-binding protein [Candidatus Omnitrophica bacterium]|nr:single-stranded DNA-binding protein [Candidatus Omnitrophota bacterium]
MANFNKVLLMGNLTRDPELRYTPQGTAVVNLGLAVNRQFKDRNQELKKEVCFVTVVAWDKQAEICNQYLHKGSPVFVEGRLQSRSWEDNSGAKRSVVEVRAERIQFLGPAPAKAAPLSEGSLEEPSTATSWLNQEPEKIEESEEKINEGNAAEG